MLELILNRRLRYNYHKILEFQTKEEIEKFLLTINERERSDLFAYTYGYAIRERQKNGIPIKEYFLLHCDEFIPDVKKSAYDRADKTLNIIYAIAIVIIVVVMLF